MVVNMAKNIRIKLKLKLRFLVLFLNVYFGSNPIFIEGKAELFLLVIFKAIRKSFKI
jgi:hypothetical protein